MSKNAHDPEAAERDLYVGYLPAPRRHVLASRLAVAFAMVVVGFSAFCLAKAMNEPGEAVWDTTELRTITGVLHTDLVPLLVTETGTFLLVEAGKFGLRDNARELSGHSVRVSGFELSRDSLRMMELTPGDEGLIDLQPPTDVAQLVAGAAGAGISAEGEIIDSKCYLGAMKPGQGRAHKACATLCIRGGIPAIFVGRDSQGEAFTAVIEPGPEGRLADEWLPFIGEAVRIKAIQTDRHGLAFIELTSVNLRDR